MIYGTVCEGTLPAEGYIGFQRGPTEGHGHNQAVPGTQKPYLRHCTVQ